MGKTEIKDLQEFVNNSFATIRWEGSSVRMLDQRRLPEEEIYIDLKGFKEVADAIKDMVIRGAPAIGVAAAMGIALGVKELGHLERKDWIQKLEGICDTFLKTRPTAVNIRWAVERMRKIFLQNFPKFEKEELIRMMEEEALRIYEEDILTNILIGENGESLIEDGATVLTHCNAGALATAGYGTALGVIRSAFRRGKRLTVLAGETRPYLQGARLTAWELQKDGIPVTVITDNMAGFYLWRGDVDLIIVGADRIAANGDVANKIGTYTLAVLSKENGVPFYIAAPLSTFDINTPSGREIPVEERDSEEVLMCGSTRIAPRGVRARYPAFDITPNHLITGIITEEGIVMAPFKEKIRELIEGPNGKA